MPLFVDQQSLPSAQHFAAETLDLWKTLMLAATMIRELGHLLEFLIANVTAESGRFLSKNRDNLKKNLKFEVFLAT
jgi:hypothetical protein